MASTNLMLGDFCKTFYNAKVAVFRIINAFYQCHAEALRAQKILVLLPFLATSSHEIFFTLYVLL